MSRIVVTGGSGFIGSHISRRLVNDKHKVIIIDNLCEGKLENIKDIKNKVEFYKKDIIDLSFLNKIFKNADYVFHEAAMRSVPRSVELPMLYNKINIEGTLNVLLAARDNNVKRVIFASSSSVYGKQKDNVLDESLCPNPLNPYALSKLTGEIYLKQFYNLYGLQTISLRYFNVFGPFQDPANLYAAVIPIFITQMLNNKKPTIEWDGKQSRDFTYIENVVEANICAMKVKNTKGEVVNVADGKTVSISELYQKIKDILGKDIGYNKGQKRAGDMRSTLGNPIKIEKLLGYRAKVGFEQGLKKTIDWFKNNAEILH
jgi:nucleoside-diphosphate-sugar epimerase